MTALSARAHPAHDRRAPVPLTAAPETITPVSLVALRGWPVDQATAWALTDASSPAERANTVTVVTAGPWSGWCAGPSSSWLDVAGGIGRLAATGVRPYGHVSLGYGTRPLADVLGDITRWARLPVVGVFLDHAPASPFQVGPVVHAVDVARRAGLPGIVLNPGVPVDPIYRQLPATICTYEGPWTDYLTAGPDGHAAGDGHLVYSVPAEHLGRARALAAARGAGLLLVSDRSLPYPRADQAAGPARSATTTKVAAGDGAGSGGTRTTTGS